MSRGGSGYSAAILAAFGRERRRARIRRRRGGRRPARACRSCGIEVVEGDLAAGARGKGPFDVILVNGAFESRPDALIAQLAEGGRLVGVEAQAGLEEAVLIEKSAAGISRRTLFETRAAAIEAFRRAPSFAF